MAELKVSLDRLPLKRILAIEESGVELYPPDVSPEEKPLTLLQSIDFGQPVERESKKAKKDSGAPQVWPWQGLVDQFRQAQEELVTLMDFIHHVEASDVLSVMHMTKPKPLPHEACADLALRISSKTRKYKDVAKYFRNNAKALERRIEKESIFYGSLMRLQRSWKIKRQRKVLSGPGGEADFTIDLSFPLASSLVLSSRTHSPLNGVTVTPDANGQLTAQFPHGKSIKSLQFCLRDGYVEMRSSRANRTYEPKQEGPAPNGAKASHYTLRSLQLSNFDELIFECLCRETLQPSSAVSLVQINDSSLHIGLGGSLSANFELADNLGAVDGGRTEDAESSSSIFLQEGFLSILLQGLPQKDQQSSKLVAKDDTTKLLKQFSDLIRHRLAASKVVSLLEKLVLGVPQLWFQSHPAWQSCVSAWDVYFDIPQAVLKGGQTRVQDWGSLTRVSRATFQCMLVLRHEALTVEGLDGFLPLGKGLQSNPPEFAPMTSYVCSLSELSFFLLTQIAGKMVRWLLEEAVLLDSKVNRTFLSLNFDLEGTGQVSLVATPATHCINWWLRHYTSNNDDSATQLKEKDNSSSERFLGPLPLETLRALVMDILNLSTHAQ